MTTSDAPERMRALTTPLPSTPFDRWRVCVFDEHDAERVQAFYDANAAYFVSVSGKPALPTDGLDDLRQRAPADWPWTGRWYLGWLDADARLRAVADVTSDLLATNVWHLSLFIVATARHGRGDAQRLYRAIEDWARANGAAWVRLGVVEGNARAEAFWLRQGYADVRRREGLVFGDATRTVRVMVKALRDGSLDDYLALVARDRPEAP